MRIMNQKKIYHIVVSHGGGSSRNDAFVFANSAEGEISIEDLTRLTAVGSPVKISRDPCDTFQERIAEAAPETANAYNLLNPFRIPFLDEQIVQYYSFKT